MEIKKLYKMKKMKLLVVLLMVSFTVVFCQPDKVFKEQITVEKGIKYGDGTIQLTAGAGGGSMVYPSAGIPLSTGTTWGTSIVNNSANWNTAFSWGNHAGLYKVASYVPTWAEITGKPTFFDGTWTSLTGKPTTFPSTWATVSGKPTVFNPDLTVTNPLYRAITWKPDYVTDVVNKPAEIELDVAISQLSGVKLPVLTTVQINALTPAMGTLVYDQTLNVLKIYTGTWKTLITAN